MANGMFKMKITLDRHRPKPLRNNCQHIDPPNILLPTTLKLSNLARQCHI